MAWLFVFVQAAARTQWEVQLSEVVAVNADPSSTWTAALNQHSDLSWEAFTAQYLGVVLPSAGAGAASSDSR